MSNVHYFQRYSQKENVATNNTLLLLSRIQTTDPRLLQDVLGLLLDDAEIEVGAQFRQQSKGDKGSVPDGEIRQPSLQVIFETKRHSGFNRKQLEGHLKKFERGYRKKVLVMLSPDRIPDAPVRARGVRVVSTTFAALVAACREVGLTEDIRLRDIIADFEEYCLESRLIFDPADRLLIVPTGKSHKDNRAFRLYYHPAERGIQAHRYLGIYEKKSVSAIGEVENVVCADELRGRLKVHEAQSDLSKDQEERILGAMRGARKYGWDIDSDHRFILVTKFVDTEFQKSSKGGLFGRRYFSIRERLDLNEREKLPPLEEIASKLKGKTWE